MTNQTREISNIHPREAGHPGSLYGSPYYLVHNGLPLPMAVRAGDDYALEWRDIWASMATKDTKEYCGFNGRNWIGYRDEEIEKFMRSPAAIQPTAPEDQYQDFIAFYEGKGFEFPCTSDQFAARAAEYAHGDAELFERLLEKGGVDPAA